MSGTEYDLTANFQLKKPWIDADDDIWGIHLNQNMDLLDNLLQTRGFAQAYLPLAGGTMTGPVALAGNAAQPLQAVPLQQLNATVTAAPFLPLGGGVMAGPLALASDPTTSAQAVTKQYADAIGARVSGLNCNVKDPAYGAQGNGTDDTISFHAAAAALTAAGGGTFYIPAGTYLLTDTTRLPSNTLVLGAGAATVLLGTSGGFVSGAKSFFTNINNGATTLTDSNITLRDFQVDYGTYTNDPTAHALNFQSVKTIKAFNIIGQGRGCGDFIAYIGCYDSLADGCSAFEYSNCAYDHWMHPQKGRVVNCYAETSQAGGQMVNWNPEGTSGDSTGFAAVDFILANCQLTCTFANAKPMQLEPLAAGTTVSDVRVIGNTFNNVWLTMRGAVTSAQVIGNRFNDVAGGVSCFQSFTNNGGTPSGFQVHYNQCINPQTSSANLAVVRAGSCANSQFFGNSVVGTGFTAQGFSGGAVGQFWFGNTYPIGTVNTLPGGAFSLSAPDGTTLGGNIRGATSVDLQITRAAVTQVVTGSNAFAAGASNTVSGNSGAALGQTNIVAGVGGFAAGGSNSVSGQYGATLNFGNVSTGDFSLVGGHGCSDRGRAGSIAWTSGQRNAPGDLQMAYQTMRARTLDATPKVLSADGATPGAANVFNVPGFTFCRLRIEVVARNVTTGLSGATWLADNVLLTRSDATLGSTILSAAIFTQGGVLGNVTGWTVSAAADTTNGGVAITVTGIAANTIDWAAKVSSVEVQ